MHCENAISIFRNLVSAVLDLVCHKDLLLLGLKSIGMWVLFSSVFLHTGPFFRALSSYWTRHMVSCSISVQKRAPQCSRKRPCMITSSGFIRYWPICQSE